MKIKFENIIVILLFLAVNTNLFGQYEHNRYVIWYIPSSNTCINGIGFGPFINTLEMEHEGYGGGVANVRKIAKVNGISIEFFGAGFGSLFTNIDRVYRENTGGYNSFSTNCENYAYHENGLSVSLLGKGNTFLQVNGICIGGLASFTGNTNGISFAPVYCLNITQNGISAGLVNFSIINSGLQIGIIRTRTHILNGMQIGLFNNSEVTKGIQIGLWNNSDNLKGLQIGLLNFNQERFFPFVNWSF